MKNNEIGTSNNYVYHGHTMQNEFCKCGGNLFKDTANNCVCLKCGKNYDCLGNLIKNEVTLPEVI